MLISDEIIDQIRYNSEDTNWKDSFIRSYLNSNYLDYYFTASEEAAIISKKISNTDNPVHETDCGSATKDKVYLLSVDEVMNDDYGFRNSYNASEGRAALAMESAQRDAKDSPELTDYWWLRTMGQNNKHVSYVDDNGGVVTTGYKLTDYSTLGLRPVLNLDLSENVWSYAGKVSANAVYNVQKLKVSTTGTNSVSLKWSVARNADGYKVYIYNAPKGKYVLNKTVKGKNSTTCTVNNLTAGSGYKFYVSAYMGTGIGGHDSTVSAVTKPLKVIINKPTTAKTHYVKVTWKKRTCTGYEVKLATNSKFTKGVKTYKTKSNKTLSKKFTNLKKGKRYYVKVRAYKTYNGITKYGNWSSWKSVYCK